MSVQINFSFTYDPTRSSHEKWEAYVKFDFPILNENGNSVQFVLTHGMTFNEAAFRLLNSDSLKKYVSLRQDDADAAEQTVERLVN